jgi:hypothetical protein
MSGYRNVTIAARIRKRLHCDRNDGRVSRAQCETGITGDGMGSFFTTKARFIVSNAF